MTQLHGVPQPGNALHDSSTMDDTGCFDVTVLVENELTGTSARRMTELYQVKNASLRYHLIRAIGGPAGQPASSREDAEQRVRKSMERMEALQATVTGVVSDDAAVDAVAAEIVRTNSQEVVVVTGRHRFATLLHRDLATQVREQVDLPVVHLVER